jgi:hypothetical protein
MMNVKVVIMVNAHLVIPVYSYTKENVDNNALKDFSKIKLPTFVLPVPKNVVLVLGLPLNNVKVVPLTIS